MMPSPSQPQQDTETVRQRRARLIEILNVPLSTPPVSTRLRPCWTDCLSILYLFRHGATRSISAMPFAYAEFFRGLLTSHNPLTVRDTEQTTP